MKKVLFCLTTSLLLCLGCSSDHELYIQPSRALDSHSPITLGSPENSDNPYDVFGQKYRGSQSGTNPADPWQALHTLNAGPGLSDRAHAHLLELTDVILSASYDSYPSFHTMMVIYEARTMDDSVLTDLDKQFILSLASIIRHGSFPELNATGESEGDIEDEDWDLSIPNAKEEVETVLEHVGGPNTGPSTPVSDTIPPIHEP